MAIGFWKSETQGTLPMKNKKNKLFDAVQMVREIRDALYRQSINPDFDSKEFDRIKEKWTKRLEQQEKHTAHKQNYDPTRVTSG